MTQDNKNLILAISLSLLVVFGWNYFYAGPQMEKARQMQALVKASQPPGAVPAPQVPGAPAIVPPVAGVAATLSRGEALALSPRIQISTGKLSGSIALRGARLDDVALNAFHETIDPKSPKIELLSPAGSPEAYYADISYVPQPGSALLPPGPDSLWSSASTAPLTTDKPVILTYEAGGGVVFTRTISVDDQYMFKVSDVVSNKGSVAASFFPHPSVIRHGRPKLGGYAVLHEGLIGIVGDSRVQEFTYDGIEKEPSSAHALKGEGGWLGFTDKYWAAVVIPDQHATFNGVFSATGTGVKTYKTEAVGELLTVAPGADASISTQVFAGAKEVHLIDRYQKDLNIRNFDLMIDWGWFYFITKPMFWLLDAIYKVVGNFGIAILLITVIVKGLFFPLANRSYMSMARMKAVQPKLEAIKKLYPDDKQKQQQETMALYKTEKINPVAGCLPMVIQIPVFFALYKVLFVTIEMRQAPFFGWIHDLSAPDPTNVFNLFGLIPFDPTHLPVFGSFLALGIWPLIMGVSMFIQMKMNPEPADPVQKQMFTYMPIIFTFMLGTFPSGLVIYWTWNNTLSVLQQGLIMRRAGVKIELWDNLISLFGRKKSDAQAKS